MTLDEALLKRRSIRKFTNDEVSDSDIDALMHAAMSGPSACNKKPWVFYCIKNKDIIEQLRVSSLFTQKIYAPCAIVVCGESSKFIPAAKEFWVEDCSAATENILLKVTDLGLGAVWCGVYPVKAFCNHVNKVIGAKASEIPLNIIFIGHPDQTAEPRDQYDKEVIHLLK